MFDWLFPNWTNTITLTVLVGLRIVFNGYLTVIVAGSVGLRTLHTAVMGAATVLSAVLTLLLLRPSGLGINWTYVELFLQVVLVALAGYVVYSYPSSRRRIVIAMVFLGAIVLRVFMIPLYDERFVAP